MVETAKDDGTQHCIEVFKLKFDDLTKGKPTQAERLEIVKKMVIDAPSKDDGFARNRFEAQCPMPWYEEALIGFLLSLLVGGPLCLFVSLVVLLLFGTWTQCLLHLVVTLVLALHPLPKSNPEMHLHPVILKIWLMMFRYFTYRYMWTGDAWAKSREGPPWIGAAPPHGALPWANMLCMPSVNIATREFIGASADVVFRTPFLRYLTWVGDCTTVSAKCMQAGIEAGSCVGMVPDGIAGIFTAQPGEEVVALKNRKGIAKMMLRTGIAVLPAYSMGNSTAFGVWFDRWGIMEWLSRMLRVSLFIPYGRWGLPIPFRVNITLVFGAPIQVAKVENPSEAQVDELHARLLNQMTDLFNTHKGALGSGQRTLRFV